MNGVVVAHHGLILSQNGATALRKLFKGLRALFYIIFGPKTLKLDHWQTKIQKIPKKGCAPRASRAAHAHFFGIFRNFAGGFFFSTVL